MTQFDLFYFLNSPFQGQTHANSIRIYLKSLSFTFVIGYITEKRRDEIKKMLTLTFGGEYEGRSDVAKEPRDCDEETKDALNPVGGRLVDLILGRGELRALPVVPRGRGQVCV